MPPSSHREVRSLLLAAVAAAAVAAPPARAAEPLSLEDAVRAAWATHPGLAAGEAQLEAARAEAESAKAGHLPSLGLQARGIVTDEPMAAFGLRLDEQRIAAADFEPARLNAPATVGGVGLGASVTVPIYAGGRVVAGARAASLGAEAERQAQQRRSQELALGVVRAYFGAEVAAEGLLHADDVLRQAEETERFVRARNARGLLLDSEVARATAFRAQAEAERAAAAQRLASARSALALLAGEPARDAPLSTPLAGPTPSAPAAEAAPRAGAPARPDLLAARARADAAQASVTAARGALLPEVFAQGGVETLRSAPDQGATWFSAVLGARWNLSLASGREVAAARARAAAAERGLAWQERQAAREVEESERAITAADARVRSAEEAVAASESARALRRARHREGLIPLTDVLDAEAGLAGARALLRASRLEARVARAERQLALGEPVEGVQP